MAHRTIFIIDPETEQGARVSEAGDLKIASVAESRTLEGALFGHSLEDLSLGNGASLDILLETAVDREVALRVEVSGDAPLSLELYEAGTYTPPGSASTLLNRNRSSGVSAVTTVWDAPTVTTVGTLLDKRFVTSGVGSLSLWVLDVDTRYLVRATNPGGGPKSVVLGVDLIE